MVAFKKGGMTRLADDPTRSAALPSTRPEQPRLLVFWEGGSTSCPFEAGTSLVIGRGDDCDVQVLHPSVSRRHARVTSGRPDRIEDLGSSRGTRVQGALVGKTPVAVQPGQLVEIGGAFVVFQRPAEAHLPPRAGVGKSDGEAGPLPVDRLVALVAKSQLPVLIVGETGAGKEVMAERIHAASARATGPFVKLNCAAFPEGLLESELFGHEKGAFTGAVQAKPGLIETADRGTLLLDEIGEMPPSTQAKLLRTLETREVRRVGAVRSFTVDVRILSATHRDLPALVASGGFRQDLLFRLNGITIPVAPLRQEPGRILALAKELLGRAAHAANAHAPALTPAAEAALLSHSWPGNVRELRNVVERAFVLAEGRAIDAPHLLLAGGAAPASPSLGDKLEAYERAQIVAALNEANGNQTRAAAALGMSRRALINRMEAYALPRPRKP